MSRLPEVPSPAAQTCPFCGVVTLVAHETQEGCIEALHVEIGRMRGILATLRPAGVGRLADEAPEPPAAAIRVALE